MDIKNTTTVILLGAILFFGLFSCSNSSTKQQERAEALSDLSSPPLFSDTLHSPFYRSDDLALSWTPFERGLPPQTQVSFIDTFIHQLIIGTEAHGLFISPIEEADWQSFGSQLPSKKISALHAEGTTIYVGVFQFGIYKSINNGQRWEALNGNLPDLKVRSILATDTHILVATDSGIYKLRKNQEDWQQVFSGDQVVSLNEYEDKILGGTTSGVILSEDDGSSWNWIHQLGAIHNTAVLDGTIFASYISSDLYISPDWGQNWSLANYAPRDASYVYELTNSGNTFILSNNYGIHRSNDGGQNWSNDFKIEQRLFFDFLAMGTTLYAGMR